MILKIYNFETLIKLSTREKNEKSVSLKDQVWKKMQK